jgi:hypothetical protein
MSSLSELKLGKSLTAFCPECGKRVRLNRHMEHMGQGHEALRLDAESQARFSQNAEELYKKAMAGSPMKLGCGADEPAFYVDAVKGLAVALVAGPFKTEEEARSWLPKAKEEAYRQDPFSHFYSWGTCLWKNGWTAGKLNKALGLEL